MPSHRVIVGDALTMLRTLPDASVSMCCTSPPYMGLRSYSTHPQVWGGDGSCGDGEHDWQHRRYYVEGGGKTSSAEAFHEAGPENAARLKATRWKEDDTCARCGAWRGELGAEPTVDLFCAHLVDIFREVRRCLRADGSLFVVIGDSYASKPPGNKPGTATWLQGDANRRQSIDIRTDSHRGSVPAGVPEKSLLLVPFALAFALRADGWTIRSVLPWVKWQVCMPESAKDRPTSAVEYVLMCTKQKQYFWDGEAVKRPASPTTVFARSGAVGYLTQKQASRGDGYRPSDKTTLNTRGDPESGRAYRNSDAFIDSLDSAILSARAHLAHLEAVRATGGLLTDEAGDPLALLVNPQPFTARSLGIETVDHFAAFPPKLIEPLIKAGCPERCCSACGAAYKRQIEHSAPSKESTRGRQSWTAVTGQRDSAGGLPLRTVTTLGWAPSCSCDAESSAGTVLDCFAGTGTTAITAARLGRSSISIELSPAYAAIIEQNLAQRGSPLFSETVVEAPAANGHRQASLLETT